MSRLPIRLRVAAAFAAAMAIVLAGAGLRAVETMRRRAAEISADRPGERLPLPGTRDELDRLGATLNEMLARLEAAIERERDFVAEAGHELRTPLALLRAELDFALHHTEGEEELRAPLREASVDNRFAWRAAESGRALEVDAPANLRLTGDRLRLEQALCNLAENALRHGKGAVRLEARPVDGRVELHVRDEGAGLPPEFVPRAFQRFSRLDESRATGGAGLGLAIVDAIAEAHGGSARADGADVWISVPARCLAPRAP